MKSLDDPFRNTSVSQHSKYIGRTEDHGQLTQKSQSRHWTCAITESEYYLLFHAHITRDPTVRGCFFSHGSFV